jgi:endonuclease/exonuclease/phosphatase family metal-dependent hydrolase
MPQEHGGNDAVPTSSFSIATYNVHCWVGRDGRYDPARNVRVLRQVKADIVCLQEVADPPGRHLNTEVDVFAAANGMTTIRGQTCVKRGGCFGNVLLTAYPCLNIELIDLTVARREPRGAIIAELDVKGFRIRMIATHLGLRGYERALQVDKLARATPAGDFSATILAGDFNEWYPASNILKRLRYKFGFSPALGTFPSNFPLLPLDRI